MRQRAKVQAEEMTESKRVKKVSLVAGEEKCQEVSTVERSWAARRQKIWNGPGPGSGARQAFLTAGFQHSFTRETITLHLRAISSVGLFFLSASWFPHLENKIKNL